MIRPLVSIVLLCLSAVTATAQTAGEQAFAKALSEMRAGEWRQALRTAEAVGPVARDVVDWHRLRAGEGDFDAVQSFLDRNPDWPGLKLLQRRSEQVLPFGARASDVVAYFRDQPPQTGGGSLALVEAYRVLGRDGDAEAQAVLAWRSQTMSAADEDALMKRYGASLSAHHEDRLDMLLWAGEAEDAERMYRYVSEGWRALARARIALRDDIAGVDGLIEAIPETLADHPGLAFERMQWRARKGRNADAIDLMLERDGTVAALGQPSRWGGWRRSLARAEMRAGRTDRAYRLAANHGLTDGSTFADLEWLSGYLALRYRNDPEAAILHFRRFRGAVFTPISLGRAGYWEGRALEAAGDQETAALAYAFGGEYQTSFYGLLAAERAGLPLSPDLTGRTPYPDWQTRAFRESTVFKAAELFLSVDERNLAERFLTHLAESLSSEDIGSLGNYVLSIDEPHIAVMIGKRAAQADVVLPKFYYPLVDIDAAGDGVPTELALSIARRESEFDPVVISGAGARGLMQLMPGTARDMARELNLGYSSSRLLTDPAYNARLGVEYLDGLLRDFDGNVILVSAAYNAGPGRAYQWIERLGDPRSPRVDIIDWIEHIPFDETRNYVMRVSESIPVYNARLTGLTSPLRFSELIKGSLDIGPPRPRARPQPPVTD